MKPMFLNYKQYEEPEQVWGCGLWGRSNQGRQSGLIRYMNLLSTSQCDLRTPLKEGIKIVDASSNYCLWCVAYMSAICGLWPVAGECGFGRIKIYRQS